MSPRLLRRPRRALLRTRVMVGVLLVTLVALAAFDVASVSAARTYLTGQTDSQLRNVVSLYRRVYLVQRAVPPPHGSRPASGRGIPKQRVSPGQGSGSPPGPLTPVLSAPFLQTYSVMLVSGRTVRGVSPSIAITGIFIGGPGLEPRLPQDLAALAASGRAVTVASAHGGQSLRLMASPYPDQRVIVAVTSLAGVDKTVGQIELILVLGSAAAGLVAAGVWRG